MEYEEHSDLIVSKGINPATISQRVANLTKKVASYSKDLKTKLDYWELEFSKQFTFSLNEKIDDDKLELIFDKLKSSSLFDGSATDFISILRGNGKGEKRILVNRPSTLLTMIRYFVENEFVTLNATNGESIVHWDYIAENFIKMQSKSSQTRAQLEFKASNLRKNLKNSDNKVCENIIKDVLYPTPKS